MLRPRTTLIIPAYNEADRLAAGFARLERAADEGAIGLDELEVLVVDDGSTDGTAAVAGDLVGRLPSGRVIVQGANRGKGAAIRAGVAETRSERLIFTDADMAIDPRQAPALLAALDKAPIAIGSRAIKGHIDYGSWLRTRAGRAFNQIVRHLSAVELRDTQCGFKGLSTWHAKVLFHLTGIDGYAFDVEMLSRAAMLGWEVTEVPVSWSDVGGSHVRLARDSAAMLVELGQARLRSSHLPPFPSLSGLSSRSLETAAKLAHGGPLEATPVLLEPDGSATVLAALVPDGPAELSRVAAVVGGTVGWLPAEAISKAESVAGLVPAR